MSEDPDEPTDGTWSIVVNQRIYVIRCDGGMWQANELGAEWASGWCLTEKDTMGEILLHATSTPRPTWPAARSGDDDLGRGDHAD